VGGQPKTPVVASIAYACVFLRDDLNPNCETRGEIARELYLVFRALWAGSFRHISIIDLKKLVGKYYPPFSGHDQQDCHEFLVVLLGWLRDDLNQVVSTCPPRFRKRACGSLSIKTSVFSRIVLEDNVLFSFYFLSVLFFLL
jgi:ubiquitin C-terminal hydrolase